MAKKKTVKPKADEPPVHDNLFALLQGQSVELGGHMVKVESIGSYSGGELPLGQRLPMVRLRIAGWEMPIVVCGDLPELSIVPLG